MKKNLFAVMLPFLFAVNTIAQTINIDTIITGLNRPICIQNAGDERLFVVEKPGRIRIYNQVTGTLNPVNYLNIASRINSSGNEQGLLGLAFHPDYATNGYFFVDYTNLSGHTVIARYQVSAFPDTAMFNSELILMTIYQPYSNHNGGNLMFGRDGYLYISMGDGGSGGDPGNRAQNIDSLLGKILRIDVNNPSPPYYSSPTSNPFYGGASPAVTPWQGTLPGRDEIYHWGVRNPWRASFDRLTGDMWIGEVGQNAFEEIDFVSNSDTTGKNFGWKCYEGNAAYSTGGCQPQSSYTAPVYAYSHGVGCSVTGGYVYRGSQFGIMYGKYFFADYCTGLIWETHPDGLGGWLTNQLAQVTATLTNSISSFGEDMCGDIYICKDGATTGKVMRLRDTTCQMTAIITNPDSTGDCDSIVLHSCALGLQYQWMLNGNAIAGANRSTYTVNQPGQYSVRIANSLNCVDTSQTIFANVPTAIFTGLDSFYCINFLADTLYPIQSGGTFSGNGVVGNTFDPSVAGAGDYYIVYTLIDAGLGCTKTDSQLVHVDLCVGIEERNNILGLTIYPNPNHSEFNVEFSLLQNSEVELTATDAIGRNVFESKIEGKRGKQTVSVNLSASPGIYFLFLKTKSSSVVTKVIVQK